MVKTVRGEFVFRKWISLCVLIIPYLLFSILLCLCFFCRPSAEDLAINYYSTNPGIVDFIRTFYLKEGSRYFSFPMVTLICHSRFMLEHYWIIPLTLMLLFWFVLRSALKSWVVFLDLSVSSRMIYWFSTLLSLAFCSVLFEMSSFFYWMSGSVTYMPSFILFILFIQILLSDLTKNEKRRMPVLAAIILVFCICGTNEIGLYFLILFLLWCQGLYYSITQKTSRILMASLITALICLVFLILPSGVSHRAGNYKLNFSAMHAGVVSMGYTVRIIFRAVSSPFAWISFIASVFAGIHTRESVKMKLTGKMLMAPGLLFVVLFIAVLFFYFAIYLFSGELLAPRAHNLIMAFVFSVLIFCCYSYGLLLKNFDSGIADSPLLPILPLFLILVMVSSSFAHETIYNAFTGIMYDRVMHERTHAIQDAKQDGRNSVVLYPYSEDFARQGKKILPPFLQDVLKKKIMNYPDWMHFQDPVQDTALYIHYYAEYQHIDTIWFRGLDYERIGLMKYENQR
jgi:hypothetical protein